MRPADVRHSLPHPQPAAICARAVSALTSQKVIAIARYSSAAVVSSASACPSRPTF
jgi:hypothetical protein